jgi:LPS sulfotransferase NodH
MSEVERDFAVDQFDTRHDFPARDAPDTILVIASTPRCGSHLLGHVLHRTGAFGYPLEYAHPQHIRQWQRIVDARSVEDTMRAIQARRTSPNGAFGIKLHYDHARFLGGEATLRSLFPDAHYVLLTRSSLVRQAVSYEIAHQTGAWIDGIAPSAADLTYDFDSIDRRLRRLVLHNAGWRYLLAAGGFKTLELQTEDVSKNIAGTVRQIGAFTGVGVAEALIPEQPVTKKQSGDVNREWEERFLGDMPRSGTGPLFTTRRLRRGFKAL